MDSEVNDDWVIGDVIMDTYEVVGILGEGGFGRVYRVFHRGWNSELAVKSLRPDITKDKSEIEDFVRECKLWVNLGLHPNIVSCYYVRMLGSHPKMFIEYMTGGSLRDLLSERKLSMERIIDICIQILDGLAYSHKRGVVHLDFKPENVMMEKEGPVKVTDFGLASAFSSVTQSSEDDKSDQLTDLLTIRKGVGGTPAYMPPEQWDETHGELGPHSDIYSFGVMLYETGCAEKDS